LGHTASFVVVEWLGTAPTPKDASAISVMLLTRMEQPPPAMN
jgi:hypothetical protein